MNHARVPPAPAFVDVEVLPQPALPEGLLLRFKTAPGAVPRPVVHVEDAPDDGPDETCRVEGRDAADAPCPAWAVAVEDSAAGTSLLVYGGARGLSLAPLSGAPARFASHLLVPPGAAR